MKAPRRIVGWPDRQVSLALKIPVDQWLEHLLDLADEAGDRTSRREIVGALICAAPRTPKGIRELLRRYRKAPDSEFETTGEMPENVIELPARKPGPRPRSARRA